MGILEDLKLNKGQPPMNAGQFQRRVLAYNENIWPQALREQYTDAFELWKDEMRPVLARPRRTMLSITSSRHTKQHARAWRGTASPMAVRKSPI